MGPASTYGIRWPVALRLGRVSNLPTVWTNVLAGVVLSGAPLSLGVTLAHAARPYRRAVRRWRATCQKYIRPNPDQP